MIDLKELRRLLDAATPGEWKQDASLVYAGGFHGDCFDTEQWCASEADAALIAALVNAAPALLAVVEAAHEVIRGAKQEDPWNEIEDLEKALEPFR